MMKGINQGTSLSVRLAIAKACFACQEHLPSDISNDLCFSHQSITLRDWTIYLDITMVRKTILAVQIWHFREFILCLWTLPLQSSSFNWQTRWPEVNFLVTWRWVKWKEGQSGNDTLVWTMNGVSWTGCERSSRCSIQLQHGEFNSVSSNVEIGISHIVRIWPMSTIAWEKVCQQKTWQERGTCSLYIVWCIGYSDLSDTPQQFNGDQQVFGLVLLSKPDCHWHRLPFRVRTKLVKFGKDSTQCNTRTELPRGLLWIQRRECEQLVHPTELLINGSRFHPGTTTVWVSQFT